ncbi:hypothetical protein [Microbacterium sediminicola]
MLPRPSAPRSVVRSASCGRLRRPIATLLGARLLLAATSVAAGTIDDER